MPGGTRAEVFDPHEVGVYHCWNRCVRRAWLCGVDKLTGKNYNYRRRWIKKRLRLLCQFFAIEVGFYALLSNHWHLILRNRPDIVETWSDKEVVRRCLIINQLAKSLDGSYKEPSEAEIQIAANDPELVAEYRTRLSHISHFIGSLCEYLSRHINEDDCLSGTLWEGRYSCRSIEDDAGLLTTGIYVDLNQLRAGEALTPEESEYTSIGDRIAAMLKRLEQSEETAPAWEQVADADLPDSWLAELTLDEGLESDVRKGLRSATGRRLSDRGLLPLPLVDYVKLLEETGRQIVAGKAGAIPEHLASLLERLNIHAEHWVESIRDFDKLFGKSIGCQTNLVHRAKRNNRGWIRGVRHCAQAFH